MTWQTRPRVFLVEDEELTRAGTRHYLGERFEVVGEADNVTDAVAMIREREPDLVLLDVRIKEGTGDLVVEQVRKTHPDVKFLALTVSTSRSDVVRLLRVGVDGYLTKHTVGSDLPDLVDEALAGNRPISRQVAAYLLDIDEDIPDAAGVERLTPREREVVALIARGYTYREAAADLDMAVKTLENHINHIFTKLGVASRHKLPAIAQNVRSITIEKAGPNLEVAFEFEEPCGGGDWRYHRTLIPEDFIAYGRDDGQNDDDVIPMWLWLGELLACEAKGVCNTGNARYGPDLAEDYGAHPLGTVRGEIAHTILKFELQDLDNPHRPWIRFEFKIPQDLYLLEDSDSWWDIFRAVEQFESLPGRVLYQE